MPGAVREHGSVPDHLAVKQGEGVVAKTELRIPCNGVIGRRGLVKGIFKEQKEEIERLSREIFLQFSQTG